LIQTKIKAMDSITHFLPWIILAIGVWSVINGILHDIFVLIGEHGKTFDRNLLRLLFDGHILITCGVMLLLSYSGLKAAQPWAYYISLASCISLFVYCLLIWKFLKSVVTTTISLAGIILLLVGFIANA
jgi:hypothetical protein